MRRQQTCDCSKSRRSRNAEQTLRKGKQTLKQTGKTGKGEVDKEKQKASIAPMIVLLSNRHSEISRIEIKGKH